MKTLIGALITLAVLLSLVIANGIFISAFAESVLTNASVASDVSADAEARTAAVKNIEKQFSDNAFILSLSVGHDESTSLISYVADAKHNLGKDEASCLAALEKLVREIEKLKITECFCSDGIF